MTQPNSDDERADHLSLEAIRELAEWLGDIEGRQAAERVTALLGYLRGFATALSRAAANITEEPL